MKELKQLAASAVAEFIRSPDVFQFDLAHTSVIRQLEGDPQEGPLYELLQILIRGDVKVGVYAPGPKIWLHLSH